MSNRSLTGGMKVFFLILVGQFVSLTGSGMTGFALGVWVYQRTGSVTRFALVSFFASLPGILISPVAGALVDRYDRRRMMILSDVGAGFCTLAMALLLWSARLEMWLIYLFVALSSAFVAFQWPAHSAAITLLVPKGQLGRASGMVQTAQAAAQIIAPLLAGVLIVRPGVLGIMLIDVATFLFALFTLLAVRVPAPPEGAWEEGAPKGSLRREALYGWTYIRARPGLSGLLRFFFLTNFLMSLALVLISPMVLSFSTPVVLGVVLTFAGVGMLAGGVLMSVWGGPRRRIHGVLGFSAFQALFMIVGGLRPSAALVAVAAFGFLFANAFVTGSSQALWQSKVAPDVQGRVFAVRRMAAWAAMPLAYLVAGPLADRVLAPLLAPGGALAGSVGRLIGVGAGRGIAFLFIVSGLLTLLLVLASYLHPRVRMVEDELPDALPEEDAKPAPT
nr:major facilitator transporter [uncultured bacterium]